MAKRWGCAHEQDAIIAYINVTKSQHSNVRVQKTGLFLSPERPYIGASPDGIMQCDCCDKKVIVEVKCPSCDKSGLARQKHSCLERVDDKWKLQRNHSYYFQVQAQMNVCDIENADFVVWSEKDIVIERIL